MKMMKKILATAMALTFVCNIMPANVEAATRVKEITWRIVYTEEDDFYFCPDSDWRYLTEDDIAYLSAWEIKLAKNEIYAKHGRLFNNSDIQDYFDSKSWYRGRIEPEDFNENVLNKYEVKNVQFLKKYESSSKTVSGYDSYFFYNSDDRYLTKSDIRNLSAWEIKLAKNEIYARHGRKFNNSKIQSYFDTKPWYDGRISPSNFDDDVLNDYEMENVQFLSKYE